MHRSRWIGFSAMILFGLALTGCRSSAWSSKSKTPVVDQKTSSQDSIAAAASVQPVAATRGRHELDPSEMKKILAELEQIGAVDPVGRDRLGRDLQQSEPDLWPLVMRQYRAAVAFRQQAEQRRLAANHAMPPAPLVVNTGSGEAPAIVLPPDPALPLTPMGVPAAAPSLGELAPATPAHLPQPPTQTATPFILKPAELPAPANKSPARPALEAVPPAVSTGSVRLSGEPAAESSAPGVVTVAHYEPIDEPKKNPSDWRSDLESVVRAAAEAARGPAKTADDASRRAAEARDCLRAAADKLAEVCPLSVKNAAFCTRIQSFGCIRKFEQNAFQPGQTVLLYAELDNLAVRPTADGAKTALRGGYKILDAAGKTWAAESFEATEEICRHVRRDYFVGYELRLPAGLASGDYSLQFNVEDLYGDKQAHATVPFSIRQVSVAPAPKP